MLQGSSGEGGVVKDQLRFDGLHLNGTQRGGKTSGGQFW